MVTCYEITKFLKITYGLKKRSQLNSTILFTSIFIRIKIRRKIVIKKFKRFCFLILIKKN